MANKGARRDPGLRDSRSVTAQYQSHGAGESVTKVNRKFFLLCVWPQLPAAGSPSLAVS